MEGVGARLGRSSTRYGPATVFTGPVRKWKKRWVHVPPPNSSTSSTHNGPTTTTNNNGSHLLLYKWTPIAVAQSGKDGSSPSPAEEPPKRRFRYVPVSVLEEQKQDAAMKSEDESKPSDAEQKSDGSDAKVDDNDVQMEDFEASAKKQAAPAESNEANLDLSLGLKSHEGDHETDSKLKQQINKMKVADQ
ncbi:hypothetical protein QJS10_CPB15g01505 [Acorus calamus]|uniref:Uncharacterized protein n=1 Tax=Acorus calamus TaxID=4465 RepID=A0AAV9D842_ACOCL|nr:hypothetical protein QJS10_CPB15g01505 [Acorus calamus]